MQSCYKRSQRKFTFMQNVKHYSDFIYKIYKFIKFISLIELTGSTSIAMVN